MPATLDVVDHWTGPGRSDAVITTPPLAENGAHPGPRRGAFEHWYFDARLRAATRSSASSRRPS